MRPTKELIARLHADFPAIRFEPGNTFAWSAVRSVVQYDPSAAQAAAFLLHELAHAQLAHADFQLDIELLAREREAWDYATNVLAPMYLDAIDEELIETSLDTYRQWLYARSLCPKCSTTGLQTKTSTYICMNCRCSWRPNDARQCELRRVTIG